MDAHSLSQLAGGTRVLNSVKTPAKSQDAPLTGERERATDGDERLVDLRRRRTELVDVLAETLLEQVLRAPLGPRRDGASRSSCEGAANA